MMKFLWQLFLPGRGDLSAPGSHDRIFWENQPACVYAIGDVHGHSELAAKLEAEIFEEAHDLPGTKWIVYLGDIVDRGPASASMIDLLLSRPPTGFKRKCILGNHEVMMLQFLRVPRKNLNWLDFGGQETLYSYGLDSGQIEQIRFSSKDGRSLLDSYVPDEHVKLLETMPVMIGSKDFILVHAGLRAGISPDKQSVFDLTTIREGFVDQEHDFGRVVVHGHTPVAKPEVSQYRVNVDTGAYATGLLTAARLRPGKNVSVMSVGHDNASG